MIANMIDLTARQVQILRAIIEEFIESLQIHMSFGAASQTLSCRTERAGEVADVGWLDGEYVWISETGGFFEELAELDTDQVP